MILVTSPFLLQDTAGEEKYASLSSFYCRGAHVAILAFDLTSGKSLERLQEVFIPLLEDSAGTCLTVVVGTKVDLAKNGRQVLINVLSLYWYSYCVFIIYFMPVIEAVRV